MAATYRALAKRAARRSAGRERWRNRLTGLAVVGVLITIAVFAGGAGGMGRLPIATLRKVGTNKRGATVYS